MSEREPQRLVDDAAEVELHLALGWSLAEPYGRPLLLPPGSLSDNGPDRDTPQAEYHAESADI
jgi:hypothetical protein